MRKMILGLMTVVTLCGCQTMRGTATGMGAGVYGIAAIGKGICDDVRNLCNTLIEADKKFAEKYW